MKKLLLLAMFLFGFAQPVSAQSTAEQIIPGYYSTTGCPSGATSCWLPYTNAHPFPISGGGGSTVSSFTGDGTLLNNSASTGAVTATLANAGSFSLLGNNTGSAAAPAYINTFTISGAASIGVSSTFGWTGSAKIQSPADSIIELTNNAQTAFTRIDLGGTTSSFPAIAVNGTGLTFQLADASANTAITAGAITATGAITPSQTLGIVGTTTNNNASTGRIGEYAEGDLAQASAVSLTASTPANITSVSLTAGDWTCSGNVVFQGNTGTTQGVLVAAITQGSATLPGISTSVNGITQIYPSSTPTAQENIISTGAPIREILSATTTVYLNAEASFGTSTETAWGSILCRRAR